jgi:hypothetical protein
MSTHYPHLLDTSIYPDHARWSVPVPTWKTFGDRMQFVAIRGLGADWRDEITLYMDTHKVATASCPHIRLLKAPHLVECLRELRRRNIPLISLWGVVPGSPAEGEWKNYIIPPETIDLFRRELGDLFCGIDNGEQDNRYVWVTGDQQCPSADRRRQYFMFQRHMQRLTDDLGNHLSAMVGLGYAHYMLKEGNHTLMGAETAQGLPCGQIFYAMIRGACRQYGVPWFGGTSIFNRWGWKFDGPQQHEGSSFSGPEDGTSLNLLKRLLYVHYLYNSVAFGFEGNWFKHEPDGHGRPLLSDIGKMQKGGGEFVARNGQPGVMHAPVALLLDFFAGWQVPRYGDNPGVYKVWGAAPYGPGDYLTHGLFSLLYPGYEDSSYYHNERGFLCATPYGDMTDVLLSDAPAWVMNQYGLIIAAGEMATGSELRNKLKAFVAGGGHLVLTAANAGGLFPDLNVSGPAEPCPAGAVVQWQDGARDTERLAFDLHPVAPTPGTETLASIGSRPAVIRMQHGAGRVTVLLSRFGLNADPLVTGPVENAVDTPLVSPFVLLNHVRRAVDMALREQQLFTVGADLGFVTCRRGAGEYVLGIHNNDLVGHPFRIESLCGKLQEVHELEMDQSEKHGVGYWPKGMSANDPGPSDTNHIAGGDVRIFAVKVAEQNVQCLPVSVPPPLPRNRFLGLRPTRSLQEEILSRPTFFQNFDGVKIPGTYLRDRDMEQLRREQGWLARQKVRIIVDLTSQLNLYPDLTLVENVPEHTGESRTIIEDTLAKMERLGAKDLIVAPHRRPENHWGAETDRSGVEMIKGLQWVCDQAAPHGIIVHLQMHPRRWAAWDPVPFCFQLQDGVKADNLRTAVNTGHLAMIGAAMSTTLEKAGSRLGAILYCAPQRDVLGQWYDAHLPIHHTDFHESAVAAGADALHILDAVYTNQDDEYLDVLALQYAPVRYSPMVATWSLSPQHPMPAGGIKDVAYSKRAASWMTRQSGNGAFILMRTSEEKAEGILYAANQFRVQTAGRYKIWLGHDGGVNLFVDGTPVLCVSERKNPADPWRSSVDVVLTEGAHEVVIAFDTDHNQGWGLFFRWERLGDGQGRHAEVLFPERVG